MVDDSPAAATDDDRPAASPPGRLQRLSLWWASLVALVAVGLPLAGGALYDSLAPGLGGLEIVDIQLGARDMSRHRILTLRDELEQQLGWDLLYIALYGAGLLLGAWLLLSYSRSDAGVRWARFGLLAAVVAVLADLLENASCGRRSSPS